MNNHDKHSRQVMRDKDGEGAMDLSHKVTDDGEEDRSPLGLACRAGEHLFHFAYQEKRRINAAGVGGGNGVKH